MSWLLCAGLSTAGFEFGVDPNEDPELALALRVSMEEQRQRQEEETRRAAVASGADPTSITPIVEGEYKPGQEGHMASSMWVVNLSGALRSRYWKLLGLCPALP
jgi:hypothetical protein